jgi:hypothetical protein
MDERMRRTSLLCLVVFSRDGYVQTIGQDGEQHQEEARQESSERHAQVVKDRMLGGSR